MAKSRHVASRASSSISAKESGISLVLLYASVSHHYRDHRRAAGFRLRYFLLFSHVRNPDVAALSRWAK
jgi:hypothetical protein